MQYHFKKTVVVALGGSIVHPDGIDTNFLKNFKKFLAPFLKRGTRFVLVVGGGKLARRFQDAVREVAKAADRDKDLLGIHATWLNAHLVRFTFGKFAAPTIIDRRRHPKKLKYPITVVGGWPPGGSSTDHAAVRLAGDFGVHEAIIAGKPSHVYNKDPHIHMDAVKFHELNWKQYRKLIPRKWKPGLNAPVDPVAAKLGEREKIKAIIIDGRNLKNFAALLNGKEFEGTIIG